MSEKMLIMLNGKVYSNDTFYEAIVTDGKVIKYIGDSKTAKSYADKTAKIIDLQGRLVMPGFIDSHAHGASFTAQTVDKIDLRKGTTKEEYISTIREFIDANPQIDFYTGAGWLSPVFGEVGPEKELLDEICNTKPIIIRSAEGHSLWLNSKAIEMAGVTEATVCPEGGKIEKYPDGSIRGTFKEEAETLVAHIMPEDTVEVFKKAILEYQNEMLQYGYTASAELMISKDDNMHKAYMELADEDKMIIKTSLAFLVEPTDDMEEIKARIGQAQPELRNKLSHGYYIKIFADGVVEGKTAWLKQPYADEETYCGESRWKSESLFNACKIAEECGYDIHFHVIGDAAVEQITSAIEYVISECGQRSDRRPVAAHVQLADPHDVDRMAAAGISVSANPYWFVVDDEYTKAVEIPLLGERAKKQYPMKSLFDKGIVVSTGSDFSITPEPNPLAAVYLGIRRCLPGQDYNDPKNVLDIEERADFRDMINSITINGAYTLKMDDVTGSLEVGKLADMAVLDKDIFSIPLDEILEVQVDMTISEGKIVYER